MRYNSEIFIVDMVLAAVIASIGRAMHSLNAFSFAVALKPFFPN